MADTKNALEELMEKQQKVLQEVYDQTVEGKLILRTPIKDGDNEFTELHFNFTDITGADFIAAINTDRSNQASNKLSITQAVNLFVSAVIKDKRNLRNGRMLDKYDILNRMDWQDQTKAWQVADAFFQASSRLGEKRIGKE